MGGINYEDLELRALAHMLPYCPDLLNMEESEPWDPAPPLRTGPQRCLSSRETIERLSTAVPGLLAAEPYQVERTLKRAAMHWRDIFERDFPAAARYFPEHSKPRHVWLGGDYIDDGTGRPPTPEEAAERWRQVREALVAIEREGAVAYMNPAYQPHTRDRGVRG